MFGFPGSRAKQRVLPPVAGVDIGVTRVGAAFKVAVNQTSLTASTSANVALTGTGTYFDGPTVSQGSTGTWFATGNVLVNSLSGVADKIQCKLWDGTTVVDSGAFSLTATGSVNSMTLSGVITNPVGNIRISVNDATSSQGVLLFNNTTNNKDSTITVIRIG